jgi:tRNA/rRNA methyltransferase
MDEAGLSQQIFLDAHTPVVILARPQMGENIGAAARAMKNCGLANLRLIAPRDGWPNPAARPMATVGTDILDRAEVYDTLGAALHDIRFMVATSARPRDMEKPVLTPRLATKQILEEQMQGIRLGTKVALLFGAERSGLDNDELVLADCVAQAPLQKGASSLNLAQAVFLMAWEWRVAGLGLSENTELDAIEGLTAPAELKLRDFFLNRLENTLDEKGFFSNYEMAPAVKRNLRSLFARARPTEQELRTLHGIITLFERDSKK